MAQLSTLTKKRIVLFVIAAVLLSSALMYLNAHEFLSNVNYSLTDTLYGGNTPLSNIIIVAIDDQSIKQIGRWPWDRAIIAQLLEHLDVASVIGIDLGFYEPTPADEILLQSLQNKNIVLAAEFTSFEKTNSSIAGKELLTPAFTPPPTTTIGYVNIITDNDGITRRANLNLSSKTQSFAQEVFTQAFHLKRESKSDFIINYPNKPYTYHHISAIGLLTNQTPKSTFENKIVLIGATSPSLKDNYFIPTSQGIAMPGVEIHASIIQTLLTQSDLTHQSKTSINFTILLTIIIVGTCVLVFRPSINLPLMVALFIIYEITAILLYNINYLLNMVYLPLTILISYPLFYAISFIVEEKEKKRIRTAFGKYLSPTVIDHLLKKKENLELGGQERQVTIFFSDIRGFTALSEKLTPTQLVTTLNEYFGEMTSIIIKHQGIVDKYIGDAIMAFWGAPLSDKKQAEHAARTCLEMKRSLPKIKQRFSRMGLDFDIGIGLNSGLAVVGNLGCQDRFDYTIIGDSVNLASRLESLTKQYGVQIIISEHTKSELSSQFITRKLDIVAVKGKSKPVAIYELYDLAQNLKQDTFEFISTYQQGLDLYQHGQFAKARIEFEHSYALKQDKASKLMIQRCQEYILNTPPQWNGVYIATSK